MFDVLVIGGGAAGMSCALVLGSAQHKEYAKGKRIGVIMHQKASHLQSALFNNVLGLAPGTTGAEILEEGKKQLKEQYPHVRQIEKEKVKSVYGEAGYFIVTTNKNQYKSNMVVVAVGYTNLFNIKGFENDIIPHEKSLAVKKRIALRNVDHVVRPGLFVAGSLAGWRSQFATACGSGAHVATDILTIWNGGVHTKVHDKII